MRFLLDENFPLKAIEFLNSLGHQTFRALEFFPQGSSDELLFDKAQELNSTFLTTDKDFFHTVPFRHPDRSIPVVAFTLEQPNRERIIRRLSDFLRAVPSPSPGDIFLVSDTRILKKR